MPESEDDEHSPPPGWIVCRGGRAEGRVGFCVVDKVRGGDDVKLRAHAFSKIGMSPYRQNERRETAYVSIKTRNWQIVLLSF